MENISNYTYTTKFSGLYLPETLKWKKPLQQTFRTNKNRFQSGSSANLKKSLTGLKDADTDPQWGYRQKSSTNQPTNWFEN